MNKLYPIALSGSRPGFSGFTDRCTGLVTSRFMDLGLWDWGLGFSVKDASFKRLEFGCCVLRL